MHGLCMQPSSSLVLTQPTRWTKNTNASGRRVHVQKTQAIFKTKTKKPVEEEVVAPPKRGLFGLGQKQKTTEAAPTSKKSRKSTVDKASEYKKRQGVFGSVIGSFDFAEVRSKSDAELLYDAKYGKLKDGKMTREQYGALRRKIGGTAKDYWKDWVEVKGEYTDKGYVSESTNEVVGLPFLISVVVALLGTLGYVVSATAN